MISIIPQEYVSDRVERCEEVKVTDVNGGTRVRQKASEIAGNRYNREVAIVPR